MSILPYGTAAFSGWRSTQTFESAKTSLSELQMQLASGKASTTYSGLGVGGAGASLSLRTRITTLDNYAASIADGQLRLKVMNQGLEQISKFASGLSTSLAAAASETPVGATNVAVSAKSGFEAVVDILNSDLAGRYLFSGRATDTEPVESAALLLNGDDPPGRAGVKTLIEERRAADRGEETGSRLLGRLTLTRTGADLTLGEDAGIFGMKIAGATATGSGVTASLAAGAPPATISVVSQPAAGDTISIDLTLPDGSTRTVKLVAGGSTAAGTSGFEIGATLDDTAANIETTLKDAVREIANGDLAAASAMTAASGFFAAGPGNPPRRVVGPDFANATTDEPGTSENTVIWYKGDSVAPPASPRDTAPVKIGDARIVGIGAQANEAAFQTVLASFAVLATDSFPADDPADPHALKRYQALSGQIAATLNACGRQNVSDITTELAVANVSMNQAAGDLKILRAQTEDSLAGIENADPTEAAMKLLATQTRLEASYQTTSVLQRLSLVNYL